ncbi:MAG TPA: hypothetical protein VHY80_15490 [Stellaceae bacterium]|nr:hypothetical protein [Stellaceae bacterium]
MEIFSFAQCCQGRVAPLFQRFDSGEAFDLAGDRNLDRRWHRFAPAARLPPLEHHEGAMQSAVDRNLIARQARHVFRADLEDIAKDQVFEPLRLGLVEASNISTSTR